MHTPLLPALLATGALLVSSPAFAVTGAFDTKSSGVITMAVYGDAPYGTSPTDTSQTDATPAFIDSINADPTVSLILHVGDIHSGKQFCTQAYDQQIHDLWTAYIHPLIWSTASPGRPSPKKSRALPSGPIDPTAATFFEQNDPMRTWPAFRTSGRVLLRRMNLNSGVLQLLPAACTRTSSKTVGPYHPRNSFERRLATRRRCKYGTRRTFR